MVDSFMKSMQLDLHKSEYLTEEELQELIFMVLQMLLA